MTSMNGFDGHNGRAGLPTEQHGSSSILEPIAIVGYALEFPQDATSAEAFWNVMIEGVSTSTEIPPDRWSHEGFYHPDPNKVGAMNVRRGHFLKSDIAEFDAPFFSITPAEAACMDPQQRLLLETTYRALENAGIPMEKIIKSKTSVTIGSFNNDYKVLMEKDSQTPTKYFATGAEPGMLANRLSWSFDLSGPSMQIDSACSSSLNALHIACQGLRNHDADMGLVGGCNLFISPETMLSMTDLGLLSPDGICYSFDARANGYARGEGIGVIVVKLLSKAIRDGDTIRALVRATGSNQDGKTPVITQPSNDAQVALIRDTYQKAGLDPGLTRFFEAHGTGTRVGDPIEAGAIHTIFGKYRSQSEPLFVGAVKSNIGHLEGASGVAGLIKTVMILEKGIIPRNTCFEQVNPMIPKCDWNLDFPTENIPWPTEGLRRASVNSFGFGGANSHAVLDDAFHYFNPSSVNGFHRADTRVNSLELSCSYSHESADGLEAAQDKNGIFTASWRLKSYTSPLICVLCASDETGIDRLASTYDEYFMKLAGSDEKGRFIHDLAFTLAEKRSHLPWRSYFLASTHRDLVAPIIDRCSKAVRSKQGLKLGFVFTGQGSQWWAMGRELLKYDSYRESLVIADQYFSSLGCEWSLINELLLDESKSRLGHSFISQPACTALQIALVQLLDDWNITPTAVVGHSSGEIAAAYTAGHISRESAWKIAYFRGLVTTRLRRSKITNEGMLAVASSEASMISELQKRLNGSPSNMLSIACINSPQSVTISGDSSQLDALQERLIAQSIVSRKLKVNVAYHSKYMNSIAAEYGTLIQNIEPGIQNMARPLFFSSLTGQRESSIKLQTAEYWVRNLTEPVQFLKAMQKLCSLPLAAGLSTDEEVHHIDHILEMGPHSTLRMPIKEILKSAQRNNSIGYDSLLRRGVSALQSSLDAVASLFCLGYPVRLAATNAGDSSVEPRMLVDAPYYPFNHSQRYWIESRLSKNFRFRRNPEHELLGSAVPDWNILDARWRKIVRLIDNEWISHHKVNNAILYPGAGMIVLAIEAAKQLADVGKKISGFKVQDVNFNKTIMFSSEQDSVEIETSLRLPPDVVSNSSARREFCIYVHENQEVSACCRGTIIVEYEVHDNVSNSEKQKLSPWADIDYGAMRETCKTAMAPTSLYKDLKIAGLDYGPMFQVLDDIHFDCEAGSSTGSIKSYEWNKNVTPGIIIHPAAMDGIFQLMVLALAHGDSTRMCAMLPTRVESIWMSANATFDQNQQGKLAEAFVHVSWEGLRTAISSATALDVFKTRPVIVVSGLLATTMKDLKTPLNSVPSPLCYNIIWKPDLRYCSGYQIEDYLDSQLTSENETEEVEILDLGASAFIIRALQEFSSQSSGDLKPHLRKYLQWMEDTAKSENLASISTERYSGLDIVENNESRNEVIRLLECSEVSGSELIVRVGNQLADILHGKVEALQVLFNDDTMDGFYSTRLENTGVLKLLSYLQLLAHKNPGLNILEVGAGTGSITKRIVEALTNEKRNDACFAKYTFTDISVSFFENARTIFQGLEHRVAFQALDLEEDTREQNYEMGAYDLVVASNTLHATKDIAYTLQNIRQLLKPGGKLILYELTRPESIRTAFIFATLPGWWLSVEDFRQRSPLLTPERWHVALRENGFEGIDFHWPDRNDSNQRDCSVIIATASEQPSLLAMESNRTIVVTQNYCTGQQHGIVQELMKSLGDTGDRTCEVVSLDELHERSHESTHYIFLCDIEHPILGSMTDVIFSTLKEIIWSSRVITWVTSKSCSVAEDPDSAMAVGLARAAKSEGAKVRFTTLALEHANSTHHCAGLIIKVHNASMTATEEDYEPEFEERGGLLCISRLVEDNSLSNHVTEATVPQPSTAQKLSEHSDRSLELTIASPGLLDTFEFNDKVPRNVELKPDEIEVEVKASGLTFRDMLIATGSYSDAKFGLEFAGTVIDRGAETSLRIGDRVCGWSHGTTGTRTRCKAVSTLPMPATMSFETAAALPVALCTAYYSLIQLGHIKKGKKVLIHSAAGAIGQAAVQIARMFDAEIFATVGNEEKQEFLRLTYGIPDNHIFSSRTTEFKNAIKHVTNGGGMDIILNSLRDDALIASYETLAPFGHFIEIGRKDDAGSLNISNFKFNGTFSLVDMSHILQRDALLIGSLMSLVMRLIKNKTLSPPHPVNIYKSTQTEEAFRFLQSGKSIGKIVISLDGEDVVQVVPRTISEPNLDPKATYVIAGGLGGIGQSIARWMASQGARHLMLLSRSGAINTSAKNLVSELQNLGVTVTVPVCDIADKAALRSILQSHDLPPIKGCIQSTLALCDTPLESMSLSSFQIPLRPKIAGSWNLHTLLPQHLDFFILLSSCAGIAGSRSQANYAVGNTYQDGLARHRVARGQRAYAIDLGVVRNVGYSAERAKVTDYLVRSGFGTVAENEVLAMLAACCDPGRPLPPTLDGAQVVTGIETQTALDAARIPEPYWMNRPLFRHVRHARRGGSGSGGDAQTAHGAAEDNWAGKISAATSVADAARIVQAGLVGKLSRSLGVPVGDIDADKPAYAYGVDSLGAVEVRNWIVTQVCAEIPVFTILGKASIADIARLAAGESRLVKGKVGDS